MADLHEIRPQEAILSPTLVPSTFESLASGASGGVSLVLVGHPLDLLKVRLQTTTPLSNSTIIPHPSMRAIFTDLFKREGFSGIYRGVTAPLLGVAPIFALNIWSYDTGKSLASKYVNNSELISVAIGGAFSAIPTSILQVPGDRIKLRLQVSNSLHHSNPIGETMKIWKEGGLRSIYKGYWITIAREIPGSAIYFSNYYYAKLKLSTVIFPKFIDSLETINTLSILIAGGSAGMLNGLLTLPIDTVKSRLQSAPNGTFKSSREVLAVLLEREGPTALFRGLGPVLLRAFPANAACFGGIELVRYFCK